MTRLAQQLLRSGSSVVALAMLSCSTSVAGPDAGACPGGDVVPDQPAQDADVPADDGAADADAGWTHLACELPHWTRHMAFASQTYGWPRYFPVAGFFSSHGFGGPGEMFYYAIMYLPSPTPPADWDGAPGPPDPVIAWYQLDLQDYSILPIGRLPGPPITCADFRRTVGPYLPHAMGDMSLPNPGNICVVSDPERFLVLVVASDRGYGCETWMPPDWGCMGAGYVPCEELDGEDRDGLLMGIRDIGINLVVPVGILYDGSDAPRPETWDPLAAAVLLHWWDRYTFPDLVAERLHCDEMDSVFPGTNALCPAQGGPCCRCTVDAECPASYRCTGRTAAGITYCLPE